MPSRPRPDARPPPATPAASRPRPSCSPATPSSLWACRPPAPPATGAAGRAAVAARTSPLRRRTTTTGGPLQWLSLSGYSGKMDAGGPRLRKKCCAGCRPPRRAPRPACRTPCHFISDPPPPSCSKDVVLRLEFLRTTEVKASGAWGLLIIRGKQAGGRVPPCGGWAPLHTAACSVPRLPACLLAHDVLARRAGATCWRCGGALASAGADPHCAPVGAGGAGHAGGGALSESGQGEPGGGRVGVQCVSALRLPGFPCSPATTTAPAGDHWITLPPVRLPCS